MDRACGAQCAGCSAARNGRRPRNNALAAALVLLAENIERDTKKSWLDDPWVGFALANGVEHLVRYFTPGPAAEGTPPTPKAVEELAKTSFANNSESLTGLGSCRPHSLFVRLSRLHRPGQ
jgi:hypothetical protein